MFPVNVLSHSRIHSAEMYDTQALFFASFLLFSAFTRARKTFESTGSLDTVIFKQIKKVKAADTCGCACLLA